MLSDTHQWRSPKLSICIPTLNRAAFIGETLESILCQITHECEVVIVDGGSTDGTAEIVADYARRFDQVRYVREQKNNGLDRDCDRGVELACGDYCWLMPDDDILKQGAIAAVLKVLHPNISMVVVNLEMRNIDMSQLLQRRVLSIETDRVFESGEMDRLAVEVGSLLTYMGSVIIKREIWLERERRRYYGSLFVYLGVIFQERLPGDSIVLAEPCISYRRGNEHTFSSKMFETFMVNFPSIVWSLALSDAAKSGVCKAEPWRSVQDLLLWRGRGLYSLSDYRRWIRPRLRTTGEMLGPRLVAMLPGVVVNTLLLLFYSLTKRRYRGIWQSEMVLHDLRESGFHVRKWRGVTRA